MRSDTFYMHIIKSRRTLTYVTWRKKFQSRDSTASWPLYYADCCFHHPKDVPWREWVNSSQQGRNRESELCAVCCSEVDALKIEVRWHLLFLISSLFSNVALELLKHFLWNNLLWKELCKITDANSLTRMMFVQLFERNEKISMSYLALQETGICLRSKRYLGFRNLWK